MRERVAETGRSAGEDSRRNMKGIQKARILASFSLIFQSCCETGGSLVKLRKAELRQGVS